MSRYPLVTATLVLGLFLGGSPVKADPCPTTNLTNIFGTTCTIGDKTFAFSAGNPQLNLILFTPDTTNPLSPGFTLSKPSSSDLISIVGDQEGFLALQYVVSVTDGSASLLGDTFTLAGTQLAVTTLTGSHAFASVGGDLGVLSSAASIFCDVSAPPPGCSTSLGPMDLTGGVTLTTPVASATGDVLIHLVTAEGGTARSGASFSEHFNEAPATTVPEPSSLLLLATGLFIARGMRGKMVAGGLHERMY